MRPAASRRTLAMVAEATPRDRIPEGRLRARAPQRSIRLRSRWSVRLTSASLKEMDALWDEAKEKIG